VVPNGAIEVFDESVSNGFVNETFAKFVIVYKPANDIGLPASVTSLLKIDNSDVV
jgi:hypothetical protein